MIDHTGVVVSDFELSKEFYRATLSAIGYELLAIFPASVTGRTDVAGFGEGGKPDFWIYKGEPNRPPVHVAFRVSSRQLVQAFHDAALAAGGATMGRPVLALIITRAITAVSYSIRMGTTSRRSSTAPDRPREKDRLFAICC